MYAYGSQFSMGTLEVLKMEVSDSDAFKVSKLFTNRGNSGTKWHRVRKNITLNFNDKVQNQMII